MGKLTKGALAMVLAGAVTFSVMNTMFVDESSKQVVKEHDVKKFEAPKKSDIINQQEKMTKIQTPTSKVKGEQANSSQNIGSFQEAEKNRNKIVATNHQNNEKAIRITTTNSINKNVTTTTTPTEISSKGLTKAIASTSTTVGTNTTTIPATETNTTRTKASMAKTKTITTGSNTTSATNHGQQVSQVVTKKAQDKKEKNGKNM